MSLTICDTRVFKRRSLSMSFDRKDSYIAHKRLKRRKRREESQSMNTEFLSTYWFNPDDNRHRKGRESLIPWHEKASSKNYLPFSFDGMV